MLKSTASRTVGSETARARRERSRAQKSAVRSGRVRVDGPAAWRRMDSVRRRRGRRGGEVSGVLVPLFGRERRRKEGLVFGGVFLFFFGGGGGREWVKWVGFTYWVWRWMRQRLVRGRKKPLARTCASAFGIGFCRFFSTAMREEKVRTLRTSGPETLSAASKAIGWSIDFSNVCDIELTGEEDSSE